MQGITTEILGQDGISMAPLPEQYISPGGKIWPVWTGTVTRWIITTKTLLVI